jgi:hypothetical protein
MSVRPTRASRSMLAALATLAMPPRAFAMPRRAIRSTPGSSASSNAARRYSAANSGLLRSSRIVASSCDVLALTIIFHESYIPYVEWEVEYTDEFGVWWDSLSESEQAELAAKVELLQEFGPTLPRPHSDTIVSSRHSNMKELRGKVDERRLRVLYAFDPRRTAILLIGGDKTGDPKWYERFVPIADDLFDRHLKDIAKRR